MTSKNKALVILNTITLAIMLFSNYAASSGIFSTVTVGEISNKYDTLFAPAVTLSSSGALFFYYA
jgi:hypothetical protein